jgi:hypothetical protein
MGSSRSERFSQIRKRMLMIFFSNFIVLRFLISNFRKRILLVNVGNLTNRNSFRSNSFNDLIKKFVLFFKLKIILLKVWKLICKLMLSLARYFKISNEKSNNNRVKYSWKFETYST